MTDQRDLNDPALDAAWRAQSTETPPPALDAAILAAAHRAVKSAPEKIGPGSEATRPWRWWTPLAAAATIGAIAIGALQLLPREPDPTNAVVSDTPPAVASKSATATQPPVTASEPPPASPAVSGFASGPTPPEVVPQSKPSSPAPRQQRARAVPPPATASDTASSDAASSREEKIAAAPAPAPEPFPARRDAPAAAPTPQSGASNRASPAAEGAVAPMLAKRAMRDEVQSQRSPDDFVARIRKFFADSNMPEAQRELAAFRAAYADADARLPADLRPWAATVPRN